MNIWPSHPSPHPTPNERRRSHQKSFRPTPPLASGGGAEEPLPEAERVRDISGASETEPIRDRYSNMYLQGLIHRMITSERLMYVYIIASPSGTLYTGVTNDLCRRVPEHKKKINKGFTSQYNCTKLVYFEILYDPGEAIEREKQIKRWRREKKERLIRTLNPPWMDLSAYLSSREEGVDARRCLP